MTLRPEDCIPGTLVECIDDTPGCDPRHPLYCMVKRGRLYTIVDSLYCPINGELVVNLAGFPVYRHPNGVVYGFCAWRFRRLPDERLSIFRKMLAPAPKQTEPV